MFQKMSSRPSYKIKELPLHKIDVYTMDSKKRYNDYASYLKKHFQNKMQKITIHAGFSCPNRDGKISLGGCTYCNNQTFNPEYCQPNKSITQQIDEGIQFFQKKYPDQRYLAYFQAYTNTYAPLPILIQKYEEALAHPLVDGIIIGTRPDCIDQSLLQYLQQIAKHHYVMIEYGIESTHNETLELINRGHSYEMAEEAIRLTAEYGIETCAHLILGLPNESEEIMLSHAQKISQLPLNCIKLHQLQLIKGTKMAEQYTLHPEWFHLFTADEYIELLIQFIRQLDPSFVIERFVSQSPPSLLLTNGWGLKNYEFTAKLEKRMNQLNVHQGDYLLDQRN